MLCGACQTVPNKPQKEMKIYHVSHASDASYRTPFNNSPKGRWPALELDVIETPEQKFSGTRESSSTGHGSEYESVT